jgi:hypothetical protein
MGAFPSAYLRHWITVYPLLGNGPFGENFGPGTDVRAHVIYGKPITVKTNIEEITADVQVYVRPEIDCREGSKVVYGSETFRVLKYEKHSAPGLPTPDYIKLVLVPYAEEV